MARRKKYPKLPSGYGSIQFMGKGRRNPYAVRPPTEGYDENGKAIRPKPICYTDTWMHGFAILTAWKAGTYTDDMETNLPDCDCSDSEAIRRILADYARISKRPVGVTFSEAYRQAYEWKFSHKTLSEATKKMYQYGFKYCEAIHDKELSALKQADLQKVIDDCKLSSTSKDTIKHTMSLVYKYAIANDIVSTDYSIGLLYERDEVKHGQAFTEEQLKMFWKESKTDDNAKRVLIMCYSGYRVSAYKTLEINLKEKYFKGGVKTAASKNRIVPIHSAILGFVKYLLRKNGTLGITKFSISEYLNKVASGASPHWTRHTFSALCEKYGVRENDRKRLLGHVVGDITNDVYGHRTIEDLRTEIEKIVCSQMHTSAKSEK